MTILNLVIQPYFRTASTRQAHRIAHLHQRAASCALCDQCLSYLFFIFVQLKLASSCLYIKVFLFSFDHFLRSWFYFSVLVTNFYSDQLVVYIFGQVQSGLLTMTSSFKLRICESIFTDHCRSSTIFQCPSYSISNTCSMFYSSYLKIQSSNIQNHDSVCSLCVFTPCVHSVFTLCVHSVCSHVFTCVYMCSLDQLTRLLCLALIQAAYKSVIEQWKLFRKRPK